MDWDEFIGQLPESHTIGLEPWLGVNGYSDQYGPAAAIDRCFVDSAQRKRVRVQTEDAAGEVVVSSTQVYCPPGTTAPPKSRVTLPSGVVSRVLTITVLDAAGLDLPEHVTLFLE